MKKPDLKKMLHELNIPTVEQGPDCQPGWLNIRCPKCPDPKHHGGFHLAKAYYNCWRCGPHRLHHVFSALLGITTRDAIDLLRSYGTYHISLDTPIRKKGGATRITLPPGTGPLTKRHEHYLKKRNFDPNKLKKIWKLRGTNHIGSYNFRIIAPIFYNNRLVSYQGRDITNVASIRYKACPIDKEVIHHKYLLYGIDYITNRRCVIVEGITDVWRLGPGSVCTFGTGITLEQGLMLSQRVDYAALLFDNDKEASQKADKLSVLLQSLGVDVMGFELDHTCSDPAELTDSEAALFMESILQK